MGPDDFLMASSAPAVAEAAMPQAQAPVDLSAYDPSTPYQAPAQGSSAPTGPSSASPDQTQSPTPVSELTVTAPPSYKNTAAANSVQSALNAEGTPQGGSVNPGVWGLLPANMQHGTLRNVLGALGDAFLVGSGHQPAYEQRMQNQQIGRAMAGYMTNPQQAIERVAQTGAPGSIEMAKSLEEQNQNLQIRKQIQEQNNQYRQDRTAIMQQNADSQAQARQDKQDSQHQSLGFGILRAAAQTGDPNKYAAARASVLQRYPHLDATLFPEDVHDFQNGYGLTANQAQVAADKDAGRGVSTDNSIRAAGSRVAAARTYVNNRPQQPNDNTERNRLASIINNGGQLSPGDQAIWNKLTNVPGKKHASLLTVPGGGQQPGGQPQFQNGQVYRDKNGNTATYQNGKWITH